MKFHSFALAALCTSLVVEASSIHDRVGGHSLNSRHARLSRRGDGGSKRCRNRTPPAQVDGGNNGQKQNYTGGNDNKQNDQQNHDQQNNNQGQQNNNQGQQNNNQDQQNNNGQGKDQQNNNNNNNNNNTNNNNGGGVISGTTSGLISVASTCGDIGACSEITGTCGPNGSLGWLNCGVDGSGWRPQHVTIGDLKVVDLNEALKDSNSPFHACSAFVDKFYQYGSEFGVPPIVIASFAMQESSCNPQTTGGGGEAGLMQITHDKCGDAPGGNCYDIDYNIRTGTRFFKNTVDNAGGNVLKAIGMYNGWQEGMTYGSATAARFSACCTCQNNLDYLHQMLNGWFQNISPYARHMGQYFNLNSC